MKNIEKVIDILINVISIAVSLAWLGVLTQLQFRAYVNWEVLSANMLLPVTIFNYILLMRMNFERIDEIYQILTSKIQKDDTSEDFNS